MKIIVAITVLVDKLRNFIIKRTKKKIETHLIISEWANEVIKEETKYLSANKNSQQKLFKHRSRRNHLFKLILVDGMIIIPSTIKQYQKYYTHTSTLTTRCADNMLKTKTTSDWNERNPLSGPTLENLWKLSLYGAIIFPLSPAFTTNQNIDMENFIIGKG